MKQVIVFLSCLTTLVWLSRSESAAPSPAEILPVAPVPPAPTSTIENGPRIQFAELVHDFGKIESGASVKHEFVFTNTGNATLEIISVRPSCGCTTAGTWDTRVEPGQTGRIPLQFNTSGFSGNVTKTATVTCNAVGQSNIFLQLKAQIWKPIDISPLSVYFNIPAETFTNETKTVRIVNNLETPLTLSPPECTNRAFRVELATIREGKEFELRVTLQEALASGFAQANISMKSSSTNTPVLSIPIYAYAQPAVVASPSLISLPPGPLAAPVSRSITIRNTGTNSLVLSDPSINIPGATLSVREIQTGRVFSVTVTIPAGVQLQANQQAQVSLKSNHPKFPLIKVPVTQPARVPTAATTVTTRPVTTTKPTVRTTPLPALPKPPAPPQPTLPQLVPVQPQRPD
ncbi:MAG TPA: DUF1573 domain-containing protein [Verrucomicrobiota bacterium]|nr:DUF1573 domain-containing protein [Verrucomicrobiota bacterium]